VTTRLAPVFLVFLSLAACSPKLDTRGYVAQADWKNIISVGKTSKDEVLANFGSPSSQSSFGDESWYYISSRKETTAFLAPEIADQEVVKISFDQAGIVSNVEYFDKNSAREFQTVTRTTPTEGHQLGFFEQIVGNIGRFNKPDSGGAAAGGPARRGRY
jgi:outer membrane protein assembly factor BamE (lipoprotein component of BamABCDE complex)